MSAAILGEIVDRDAIEIGAEYQAAKASAHDMAARLLGVGQRLLAKKAVVKAAGEEWGAWLHLNVDVLGFGERSAQRIMAVTLSVANSLNCSTNDPTLASDLDDETAHFVVAKAWGHALPHGTQGAGVDEWCTPADVLDDVRAVLGEIELDPASNKQAQKRVRAKRFFTIDDDALAKEHWKAKTLFMNPPYSTGKILEFVKRLCAEVECGNVAEAILLTNSLTDTEWFHKAVRESSKVCFTRGRLKFLLDDEEGKSPTWGQSFFYFGHNSERFAEVFVKRGFIR